MKFIVITIELATIHICGSSQKALERSRQRPKKGAKPEKPGDIKKELQMEADLRRRSQGRSPRGGLGQREEGPKLLV